MSTLLERFLRYVKVETTAVELTDDYPSSPGQRELGRLLADELRALNVSDVEHDANGLVWGTVPGNVAGAPTICWLAHVDTSPEFTAKGVNPIVHRNYDGRDIALPGDSSRVIRVSDSPELTKLVGRTIITTDGRTLLGADDKSGVAVIMTAVERLIRDSAIRHGPIRVLFTCDEEVGRGVAKVDLAKVGAVCAYTLDGDGEGQIENETFSADVAAITVRGANTHPGYGYGKMVNALRIASLFVSRLPWDRLAPEATREKEGFIHPYTIEGGVDRVTIRAILRSFVTAELAEQATLLRQVAARVTAEHPRAATDIAITPQYRNMAEHLGREPRAVDLAARAYRQLGIEPVFKSIRGGTDGSRLSEMGLPTPNLSVGMHNFHSPLEFACLEQMEQAVTVLIELARLWGQEKAR